MEHFCFSAKICVMARNSNTKKQKKFAGFLYYKVSEFLL